MQTKEGFLMKINISPYQYQWVISIYVRIQSFNSTQNLIKDLITLIYGKQVPFCSKDVTYSKTDLYKGDQLSKSYSLNLKKMVLFL